jgi:hypothetical protein
LLFSNVTAQRVFNREWLTAIVAAREQTRQGRILLNWNRFGRRLVKFSQNGLAWRGHWWGWDLKALAACTLKFHAGPVAFIRTATPWAGESYFHDRPFETFKECKSKKKWSSGRFKGYFPFSRALDTN